MDCNSCGKKGHIQKVCRSKASQDNRGRSRSRSSGRNADSRSKSRGGGKEAKAKKTKEDSEDEDDVSNVVRAKSVTVEVKSTAGKSSLPTPKLQVSIRQGKKQFDFEATPDTGTTRTLISYDLVQSHHLRISKQQRTSRLFAANGERMRCEGSCQLIFKTSAGWEVNVNALVSSSLDTEVLLSWHDLIALGILSEDFPAPGDVIRSVAEAKRGSVDIHDDEQLVAALKEEYKDVLCDDLPEGKFLEGPEMKIHLKPHVEVKPKRVTTCRQIPKAYQEEADRVVKSLLKSGVLERVEEPTEWISPAHFVPKPGGKGLRLVTDYTHLNSYVERPVHPFPATLEIVQGLDCDATENATNDALWGYYQIPLERKSSLLTTFLLPSGRYRYTRAPMGLNASSDEWCARSDLAVQGLPGTVKLVDDILVQAPNRETLVKRLRDLYEKCRKAGLVLSKKKLKIGKEVKFAGHRISTEGVKPIADRVAGIKNFPRPKDLTEMRQFLGAVNQLGFFIPDLAQTTAVLRALLQKGKAYVWLDDHEQAFRQTKELLTSEMVVKPFNSALPTELLTDASRNHGIGYALLQREEDGRPRLIQCGSKSLNPAQSRYATIELECHGVKWGMKKCDFFLRGLNHFEVITDHKPLVGIFKKDLCEVENARLASMREKLVDYSFTVKWVAGKDHLIADALSRAPVFPPEDDEDDYAGDSVVCNRVAEDPRMQSLFDHAEEDVAYRKVVDVIRSGTDLSKLPSAHPAHLYRNVWHELALFDDANDTLLVLNDKLVVPSTAVPEILSLLHLSHAGMVKTKQQARSLYFWPKMNRDIEEMIRECNACQALQPSQPREPELPPEENCTPMSHVGVDLWEYAGRTYLVMVDRYSGFPLVQRLRRTHTEAVTEVMRDWFLGYGIPAVVRSDGGPQFRSEFKEFLDTFKIRHELSSAYNPTSNGLAESSVKQVKHLLIKTIQNGEDYKVAVHEYRNTKRHDGFSPAEMMLGRRQRSLLPALKHDPIDNKEAEAARQKAAETARSRRDGHATPLSTLQPGQQVLIQDPVSKRWHDRGVIISCRENGRSYVVQFADGAEKLRNRRFLRPTATRGKAGERGEEGQGCVQAPKPEPKKVLKKQKKELHAEPPRRSERLAAKKRKVVIDESKNEVRFFQP